MMVRLESFQAVTVEPVHLPPVDAARAAALLARAFQEDPMTRFILPDPDARAGLLPWFLGATVDYGLRYGEVYTTPGVVEGVAIWLPPGKTHLTLGRMLRAGMLATPFRFGPAAFGRFVTLVSHVEGVHKRVAPMPHWYLWGLGVEPARQGQGLGGALLRTVLARADAAGSSCYLETFNPASVPFYRAHGFTVAAEEDVPKGGPRVWAMLRPSSPFSPPGHCD
jgi:ribosomal protein S18 acetylase RimI-like enzyme